MTPRRVTGVVLAAGASSRLGQPKQLLPFRDSTLLGETLRMARSCGFGQLIVTLGASADAVRAATDLDGLDTVVAEDSGTGCSASLRVAVDHVDPRSDGIVLLLGDQPDVTAETVRRLIGLAGAHPIGACRYADGVGHPFWLSRSMFGEVRILHGDKGVWKLIEGGRFDVRQVAIEGSTPLDVDTWADYERLCTGVAP